MTILRIKIVGEDADQPHMIQITDAVTGESITDVVSFDLRAHVTEGVTCTLHRIEPRIDPETHDVFRFDSEVAIEGLDIESHESE